MEWKHLVLIFMVMHFRFARHVEQAVFGPCLPRVCTESASHIEYWNLFLFLHLLSNVFQACSIFRLISPEKPVIPKNPPQAPHTSSYWSCSANTSKTTHKFHVQDTGKQTRFNKSFQSSMYYRWGKRTKSQHAACIMQVFWPWQSSNVSDILHHDRRCCLLSRL